VGTDLDCFFPVHSVYCTCILQGGCRGIAKSAGERQTGIDVSLYVAESGGSERTLVQTRQTDAQGMYRLWSGKEKAPRAYYVAVTELVSLGGFVNAEEAWGSVERFSLWDPYTCCGAGGNVWRIATNGDGVAYLHEAGAQDSILWERRAAPFGTDTSGARPVIAELDTGNLLATVTRSGGTYYAASEDRGTTWEAAALPELGDDLQFGTIKQRFGIVYACGWSATNSAIVFRASSQNDLDQDDLTGGGVYESVVCAVTVGAEDDPPRSDVVVTDDRSVLVTVDQSGNMQTYRCRRFAATSAFERVA
jgi:hypothetical protein